MKTETRTAETSVAHYLAEFRDTERFLALCRQCGNFGRRYGCPPFDDAELLRVSRFRMVRLLGVKIVPDEAGLPLSAADALMAPVVLDMNRELLQLERELDGMACGFVAACPYCGGAPCARIQGLPCRHPELVRPSLEALGFDVAKTAESLLDWKILWGRDGHLPEYLILVCGVFFGSSV